MVKVAYCIFLVLSICSGSAAKSSKPSRTTSLFDEPYKAADSRHFDVQASTTFSAEPKKQFDLSYADGSELKGFNGRDVVHVSMLEFSKGLAVSITTVSSSRSGNFMGWRRLDL